MSTFQVWTSVPLSGLTKQEAEDVLLDRLNELLHVSVIRADDPQFDRDVDEEGRETLALTVELTPLES